MRRIGPFFYTFWHSYLRQVQYGDESLVQKWINSSVENLQDASAQGDPFAQAFFGLLPMATKSCNWILKRRLN